MNYAIFIKKMESWRGDARLYRLIPPYKYSGKRKRCYVIVSGVDLNGIFDELDLPDRIYDPYMKETYIFPATRNGKATGMKELEGSFKGGIDHEKALQGMGYLSTPSSA